MSACSNGLPLSSVLLSDVNSSLLWFTEAGITIAELNDTLARLPSPLALKTMGGSPGQTLAGAIATGTHGSDFDRPPLADQVRAMYIVGAGGIHHWVEPSAGITDPSQVAVIFPCIAPPNIHYDDDLFRSALVSMGSMGVVYAAIIDVVPQYALAQVTAKTVWEDLTGLVSGANSLFADNWAYRGQLDALFDQPPTYRALQLLVNPIKNSDGTHNCYVTARFEVPLADIPAPTPLPSGPQATPLSALTPAALTPAITTAIEAQPEWNAGSAIAFGIWNAESGFTSVFGNIGGASQLQLLQSLINFCKSYNYYWAIRAVIDLAMQGALPLNTNPIDPQLDFGFNIMAGSVLGTNFSIDQVTSIEAFFGYPDAAAFVTSVLASIDANIPNNIFPAGYISLRSCGPTNALLGMEQFGTLPFNPTAPECTGAVEMSLMFNDDDIGVLETFERMALDQGGNLHWGQSNGLMGAGDVTARYPGLATWQASQQQLGGKKTFVNLFMKRLGLGPLQGA